MKTCEMCESGRCLATPLLEGLHRHPLYETACEMSKNTQEPLCACLVDVGMISDRQRADLVTIGSACRVTDRRHRIAAVHTSAAIVSRLAGELHVAAMAHASALTAMAVAWAASQR